ncbi:MAG: hypothetical protein JWS10_2343 [Cypionkella sp.]|nr:hypothetical protein [Cypionkella sp.]
MRPRSIGMRDTNRDGGRPFRANNRAGLSIRCGMDRRHAYVAATDTILASLYRLGETKIRIGG